MKDMGMEKIIFEEANVISEPFQAEFIDIEIER